MEEQEKREKAVLMASVDKDAKEMAEEILNELSVPLDTAINMYMYAIIRERGIPFPLKR